MHQRDGRERASAIALLLSTCGVGLLVAGLVGLGIWQVERRAWKVALIAQVEARVAASPTEPPPPSAWQAVTAEADSYRHLLLTGRFIENRDTLVQAVTELGGGYWVLSPLLTGVGIVLVNRGFVPADRRDPAVWRAANPPAGDAIVMGLLRVPEPGGGFLRSNDPSTDRWYSRDVAAIASARGLGPVAPFFVDEDAGGAGLPVGGLTVVTFHNNHLVYALTWFALASMLVGAWAYVLWIEWLAPSRSTR